MIMPAHPKIYQATGQTYKEWEAEKLNQEG
jgi:hypothetical protein